MDEVLLRIKNLKSKIISKNETNEKGIQSENPKGEKHIIFMGKSSYTEQKSSEIENNKKKEPSNNNINNQIDIQKFTKKKYFNMIKYQIMHKRLEDHLSALNKILNKNRNMRNFENRMKIKEEEEKRRQQQEFLDSFQTKEEYDSDESYHSQDKSISDKSSSNHSESDDETNREEESRSNSTISSSFDEDSPSTIPLTLSVSSFVSQTSQPKSILKKYIRNEENLYKSYNPDQDTDLKMSDLASVSNILAEADRLRALRNSKIIAKDILDENLSLLSEKDSISDSKKKLDIYSPLNSNTISNGNIFKFSSSDNEDDFDKFINHSPNYTALSPNQLIDTNNDSSLFESPISKSSRFITFNVSNLDNVSDQASDEDELSF